MMPMHKWEMMSDRVRAMAKKCYELFEKGKSYAEIGEEVGLSKSTVYQNVYQYRKANNFFIGKKKE